MRADHHRPPDHDGQAATDHDHDDGAPAAHNHPAEHHDHGAGHDHHDQGDDDIDTIIHLYDHLGGRDDLSIFDIRDHGPGKLDLDDPANVDTIYAVIRALAERFPDLVNYAANDVAGGLVDDSAAELRAIVKRDARRAVRRRFAGDRD